MGLEEKRYKNSIRLCIGRQNTIDEIKNAFQILHKKILNIF